MAFAIQRFGYAPPVASAGPTKGSYFKRLVQAIQASRQAQAEREIARHRHLFDRLDDRRPGAADTLGR